LNHHFKPKSESLETLQLHHIEQGLTGLVSPPLKGRSGRRVWRIHSRPFCQTLSRLVLCNRSRRPSLRFCIFFRAIDACRHSQEQKQQCRKTAAPKRAVAVARGLHIWPRSQNRLSWCFPPLFAPALSKTQSKQRKIRFCLDEEGDEKM
jgi:hypothetical protein